MKSNNSVPPPADEQADDISLCSYCNCMTHTIRKELINNICGKCGGYKGVGQVVADELDAIIKPLIAKSRCGFCGNCKCPHIDEAKAAIAAYSRTQTEAVLERLKTEYLQGQYLTDGKYVRHIDAEIARLRGKA